MRGDHAVEGATCLAYPITIKMKDFEIIKEYLDKLLSVANNIRLRLFGRDFTVSRIAKKILVTMPERYKASRASLANTKDASKIPNFYMSCRSKSNED